MHYKFEVEDEVGNVMEFKCYPEYTVHKWKNYIKVVRDDVGLTLASRKCILEIVRLIVECMCTTTCQHLEIGKVMEE